MGFVKKIFSPKVPKVRQPTANTVPPVVQRDPVKEAADSAAEAAQAANLETAARRKAQRGSLLSTAGGGADSSGSLSSALAYGKTSLGQ